MAKRFIDTDLFRKPLVRSLGTPYKLLWIYLLCECDHAGVWDVELDVASMRLGSKLDPAKCIAALGSSIVQIDNGKKWYLPEFVTFQYGSLNPANRVHASVLNTLSKYGIDPDGYEKEAPYKDLTSPLQGAKDKEKDKYLQGSEEERAGDAKPTKAADPNITAVVDHLTAALKSAGIAQSLDGTVKDNRFAAHTLLTKLGKDYPQFPPLESAKHLIDAAMVDEFHARNSISVRYLLNNCGKIAAASKARKQAPKNETANEYAQRVAANLADRLARQGHTA